MVKLTWLEFISKPFSLTLGETCELVELVKDPLEPTLEILCLCTNSLAGKSDLYKISIKIGEFSKF